MGSITFLIFTYNEERRLEYLLRCFQPFGEIVVMDNHSTDKTAAIAEKYGAHVYQHDHSGYVEEESVARNALSKVTTTWVYWGYADEILPKTLLLKMQEISESGLYKMAMIRRKNIHYGDKDLNLADAVSPRFFIKDVMNFSGTKIHGFGKFLGNVNEVIHLPRTDEYSIYHFSTYNISKFELTHSKYSDIESQQAAKFKLYKLISEPLKFFIRYYIVKKGWTRGVAGFIYVMQYCFFYFNIQAKIYERDNGISLESIEKKYDIMKENLINT